MGERADTVRKLADRFAAIFESRSVEASPQPFTSPEELQGLGLELKRNWFDPRWDQVQASFDGPGPHDLLIRSADPDILNLPWELVELVPGLPLGCDAGWG